MGAFNILIFVIFLIMPLLPSINASTCNSFPKIFGGSIENSYLTQIDVYNDYLALAGDTKDNSLTGMAN